MTLVTEDEAREYYRGAESGHDFDHVLRVLALAERLAAGGDKAGTTRVLTSAFEGQPLDPGQTPLAQRAARLLLDCGAAPQAVAVYRAILGNAALEQGWRATILRDATDAARAAGEQDQEAAWQMELAGSASPPPLSGKK